MKVSILQRKRYISDEIGDDYKTWQQEKVCIIAPTGSGKTHFVLYKFVPHVRSKGGKVLILVNRLSLLRQYIYEEALRTEMYECGLDILTYQQFAGQMHETGFRNAFIGYDTVIFDEIHFFVSDSDFNPHDTFFVWQAILHSLGCNMVFLTATLQEMEPFLFEYRQVLGDTFADHPIYRGKVNKYQAYNLEENYDYVEPHISADMESMLETFVESPKKGIIFIDSRERGKEIKDQLLKRNPEKEVVCIDRDSYDSTNSAVRETIKTLYMANKLKCDILITTSVLDNGISIHDPEVQNVAIFTSSKTSFIQMLGRIRTESLKDKIKLHLLPESHEYWAQRENQLEEEVKEIDRLTKDDPVTFSTDLLAKALLEDSEHLELYRKIFVLVPDNKEKYPIYRGRNGLCVDAHYQGRYRLELNKMSVAKIRQMLHIARQMHSLSYKEKNATCYAQFAWIGKKPEEIICEGSSFQERRKEELIQRMLTVQDYDKDAFMTWKREIANEFRKDILSKYKIPSGSPIKENQLTELVEEYGLVFETSQDKETRKNRYTIRYKA